MNKASKRVQTAVVGPETQDTTEEWRTLHHESRFVTRWFSLMTQQTYWGPGHLIVEVSISHSDTHTHSIGLLWTRHRPDAETFAWQHTTFTRDRHPRPPAGFEPVISAREWPQTHALDRATTGVGHH
jgi:hypothetical protein